MLIWVYGYENDEWIVRYLDPFCKMLLIETSADPNWSW